MLAAVCAGDHRAAQGTTFDATAGQEFNGKVAEFHVDAQGVGCRTSFEATIYWGDGTPKTTGEIEPKVGRRRLRRSTASTRTSRAAPARSPWTMREKGFAELHRLQGRREHGQRVGHARHRLRRKRRAAAGPAEGDDPHRRHPRRDQGFTTLLQSTSTPGIELGDRHFHWDFGDGKTADQTDYGGTTNHIYDEPGTYTAHAHRHGRERASRRHRDHPIEVIGAPKAVIDVHARPRQEEHEVHASAATSPRSTGKIAH